MCTLQTVHKTIVPGFKGDRVGSEPDMIRRVRSRYTQKITTKTTWDPQHMTQITKHYLPDGTMCNDRTLKNKISS
jgi:hypothetical protein